MNLLVTGGAGYIGSHTVVELLNEGHEVVVVDNLSNSDAGVIDRIGEITGKKVQFEEFDLRDKTKTSELFDKHNIDAVIHFAGLKAVGESVTKPLEYYDNNLLSTISMCEAMDKHDVRKLVFSSSATVYGDPEAVPIPETAKLHATNPYGQTKLMIEQMLNDLVNTNNGWEITSLRYFNPIGAHKSGLIGEDPKDTPNNLLPYIAKVATGELRELQVFGDDYDTPDGTGVRDYIHVVDLALGHVVALGNMPKANQYAVYNLGTGKGYSVMEAIAAFEKASGKKIPYKVVDRRPGDIATCCADPTKAEEELHWKATKTLDEACADAWHWQEKL